MESGRETCSRWGKPLNEMRILYTELLTHLKNPNIQPDERQFLIELDSVVKDWIKQVNREHSHTVNEHLSMKIKALCNKYESIQSARKLRDFAMDASYWYRNKVVVNQSLQQSLIQYDHSLRFFYRSTKVIIKILK